MNACAHAQVRTHTHTNTHVCARALTYDMYIHTCYAFHGSKI